MKKKKILELGTSGIVQNLELSFSSKCVRNWESE